jgi:hypothetical protein
MFDTCVETVSILYAIIFGAGDACVEIGMASLLWALAAFMVVVIIVQFGARKLWKQITKTAPPPHDRQTETIINGSIVDDPNYKDSAIRSSRR